MTPPSPWNGRRRTDDPVVSWPAGPAGGLPSAEESLHPSHRLLELGRRCDRSGRVDEAISAYEAAIDAAQPAPAQTHPLAEAWRRLAVVLQRRGQSDRAREAGLRSLDVATQAHHTELQAEALNTLGGLDLMQEHLDQARDHLGRALTLSSALPGLRGRVQQNLGILASMRGDRTIAMDHYEQSLKAFEAAGNQQGSAVAYHNLGMICADEHRWEAADQYFEMGRRTAQAVGDDHLRGLCLTNQVEVLIALRRFDAAQLAAETALSIFEQLRAPAAIADVQRMLGVVFRETNRLSLAQSHIEAAVELAGEAGSPVSQGEALCEAGRLHGRLGHLDDAIESLLRAGRRFSEVPAVVRGPEILSGRYPNLVRGWCELVASVDPEAADHSDRVAVTVGHMAALLGLPAEQQASVRLAAKLHEIGRLRTQGQPAHAQVAVTAALLGDAPCLADLAVIVGGGEDAASGLPSCSDILRMADRYDQLVAPANRGLTRGEALTLLAEERDGWQAGVYEALARATEEPAAP